MEARDKQFLKSIPYIFVGYLVDKISWLYHQTNPNLSSIDRVMATINYSERAFRNPFPSLFPIDLLVGAVAVIVVFLLIKLKEMDKKNYRKGVEYGSARWGTKDDIKPFMNKDFWQNIILASNLYLMLTGKPSKPKYARNKNVTVIGGSGSGKTRFYIKPNIMQMNSSYVITDPKGTVLDEVGKMLARGTKKIAIERDKDGKPKSDKNGNFIYKKNIDGSFIFEKDKNGKIIYEPYHIKVFNTVDFKRSMHYNPFAYLHSEKDIMQFVNALITNTKGEGEKAGEDFWIKAERLLYMAYIGYIFYEAPEEEKNFRTLIYMINASKTSEVDESFKNAIDLLFEELEADNPNHFAVRQYKKYKLAAGKTAKSILISCGARLAAFDIDSLLELTDYDELELDLIGDRMTALFVIISDTDDTFNFLASIMYTQMFNLLCDRAYTVYDGMLPIHVRCLLDEFANIGQIPKFDKLIATIRSRGISANIVLQSRSQLKSIYRDNAETILDNCDTKIFLGGSGGETLKVLSEELGKETIDIMNTSDSRGSSRSYGINNQKAGKELMSRDELAVMDGDDCIVQLRGVRPFKVHKFDIEKHPNYKLLKDYDKRNGFDVIKYMQGGLDLKKYSDIDVSVNELSFESEFV